MLERLPPSAFETAPSPPAPAPAAPGVPPSPAKPAAFGSVATVAAVLLFYGAASAWQFGESALSDVSSHGAALKQIRLALDTYGMQIMAVDKRVSAVDASETVVAGQVAELVVKAEAFETDAANTRKDLNAVGTDVNALKSAVAALENRPEPAPVPVPLPTPPAPTPAPAPTPVAGYAGALFPVLILPDPPTPDEAALRTNANVKSACDARGCDFRSYLVTETEVSDRHWKAPVDAAGGPPVVLWLTPSGLMKVTKSPTEASILSDLKAVRGQ